MKIWPDCRISKKVAKLLGPWLSVEERTIPLRVMDTTITRKMEKHMEARNQNNKLISATTSCKAWIMSGALKTMHHNVIQALKKCQIAHS